MQAPRPGTVEDGYIFVGGDPSQEANWRPVQKVGSQDAASISDMRAAAARSQNFATMADQFMGLNQQTGTGPARSFGLGEILPSKTSANLQAMKAIASRAAPSMRVPGSGATSDKDMALYMASFPKVTNWGGSNAEVTRGLKEDAAKTAARAAWAEKWAQTSGTLTGADPAFETWWSSRQTPASKPAGKTPPPIPEAPRASSGPTVPSDAVNYLRQNNTPQMRAAFDQKFGAGASQRYLSGR